jgi:stage IV sporulation protein B
VNKSQFRTLLCFLILVVNLGLIGCYGVIGLPSSLRLPYGDSQQIRLASLFSLKSTDLGFTVDPENLVTIVADKSGSFDLQVLFMGIFPIKGLVVDVVPRYEVIPGGQAIGVMVAPQGLLVVDYVPLNTIEGSVVNPAKDAGLRKGDVILSIENQSVRRSEEVRTFVERAGQMGTSLRLKVQRDGRVFYTNIKPVLVEERTSRGRSLTTYLLGLYLEEPVVGVGTLTFYEPKSGRFAALGHMVVDGSNQQARVFEGQIVPAVIAGITSGSKGRPGEKIGALLDDGKKLGEISKNCAYGIYGKLTQKLDHGLITTPIPVALARQVKTGPATILTVLSGEKVEEFTVEIVRIGNQSSASDKGLVIEITDQRLLEKTGGIIQGMSGSPIIQDGYLVGAITHVFVSNPTRGYGILAEWMLLEAGIAEQKEAA